MVKKQNIKKIAKRSKITATTKKKVQKRKPSPQKQFLAMALLKSEENPIIAPKIEHDWEAWQTFNAGVILLEDKVHFLYRAIGKDGISRLGYAVSSDGFKIDERLPGPVYQHPLINNPSLDFFSFASGGSFGGCEDPRPVRVNKEDTLYMTYTACDQELRVALTSIKVEDFLNKKWRWKEPVFISLPHQVHKNWLIFPEKIKGRYAIVHSINPQISIDFFDSLKFDSKTYINSSHTREPCGSHWNWEGRIRGVGPSPLKTKEGWLIFYHAEDRRDPGKYKVGAMLLDLEEPTKVLYCSKEPILESSELLYETNGFKPGVIYASGAVVKDNKLLIYYGGADNYVCVAYSDLEEFLAHLRKEIKPKVKQQILKEKRDDK